MAIPNPDLVTIDQAAEELKVTPKTIRVWIRRGWMGETTTVYDTVAQRWRKAVARAAVDRMKQGGLLPRSPES